MFRKPIPEIDVKTLAGKLKSDEQFVLLDVREEDELRLAKIEDKRLVHAPLSKIAEEGISALPEQIRQPDALIYVLCHHGSRSLQVTHWLSQNGWTQAVNVRGGIDEYARRVDRSVGMY